jgi:MscS family membrane protein
VHWEKLVPPVSVAAIALVVDHLIDEIVGTTGMADLLTETTLGIVVLIAAAWAVIVLGNLLAEMTISSPRIDAEGANASLISISGRVLGGAIALWLLVEGAENLGLSLIPVVAGLGIGGLAVALAVRPTLENLIGGFVLFIDKPVRVGDRCRFGDQLGDVEDIGLRSTRIRTRENTLVTIPNAEFSQMQIENVSKRELTLYQITLTLRYETTTDQLRYVVAKTREMLLGHPKVSPYDLRVRFRDLGEYSLNVEIFAYTRTTEFREYWAIREDLNLRIMDIVKEAGTGFAFPSTTEYFVADSGLDPERSLAAEEQVQEWRLQGELPFPEIDQEKRERIEDTLDYPPEGSASPPANGRSRSS